MDRYTFILQLTEQVQSMVTESGNPEGFDAAAWVDRWLEDPLPALRGQAPSYFLDTQGGRDTVMQLLRKMQSGAYS